MNRQRRQQRLGLVRTLEAGPQPSYPLAAHANSIDDDSRWLELKDGVERVPPLELRELGGTGGAGRRGRAPAWKRFRPAHPRGASLAALTSPDGLSHPECRAELNAAER
jgi:hypothetical protein